MDNLRGVAGALLITALAAGPIVAAPATGPAETPSIFALPHQLTGEVVAVNQGTLMLTVRTLERTLSLKADVDTCLLYTSPSPRDGLLSRMPSSA